MREKFSLKSEKTTRRELKYTLDFKDFVKSHPGILATFRRLQDELSRSSTTGRPFRQILTAHENGITALTINQDGGTDAGAAHYFKVETEDSSYFVKCIPGHPVHEKSRGVDEFSSLERAKELIADIDGVEVVDFQLGYQDKDDNTYFVSKWQDGILLENYLVHIHEAARRARTPAERKAAEEELQSIEERIKLIVSRLGSTFIDVKLHNMLYIPESRKIVLFDIHQAPDSR